MELTSVSAEFENDIVELKKYADSIGKDSLHCEFKNGIEFEIIFKKEQK